MTEKIEGLKAKVAEELNRRGTEFDSDVLDKVCRDLVREDHGGTGKWRQAGVPKRGWNWEGVEDLGRGNFVTCEMCEVTEIRHVHTVSHPDYPESLDVGCVCVEKMTEDYVNPKRREAELRSRVKKRERQARREQEELRRQKQDELRRQEDELRRQHEELLRRQRPEVVRALSRVKMADEILAHGGLSADDDMFVRSMRAIAEYNAAPKTTYQCKWLPKQLERFRNIYAQVPFAQRTWAMSDEEIEQHRLKVVT